MGEIVGRRQGQVRLGIVRLAAAQDRQPHASGGRQPGSALHRSAPVLFRNIHFFRNLAVISLIGQVDQKIDWFFSSEEAILKEQHEWNFIPTTKAFAADRALA
jgi:hypothetical protein